MAIVAGSGTGVPLPPPPGGGGQSHCPMNGSWQSQLPLPPPLPLPDASTGEAPNAVSDPTAISVQIMRFIRDYLSVPALGMQERGHLSQAYDFRGKRFVIFCYRAEIT